MGIAKDARYLTFNFENPIGPFFFLPEAQFTTFPTPANTQSDLISHFLHDIVVVTKPGAGLSFPQVQRAMASVDPNLPLIAVRSLRDQVNGQFTQQRLIARLTSSFAILSPVLASVGLYGVTAFNTGRRINEIGVQMADGADRGQVILLVVRGSFALIAVGLLAGVPLTLVAGRFLGSQLYGTNPYDPSVTLAALSTLGFFALLASLVPAFRASSISPMQALRSE